MENQLTLEAVVHNDVTMPNDVNIISGGDPANPTWEEYKAEWDEDYRPHIELLKQKIIELNWLGKKGSEICNYYIFVYSDGVKLGFTWRAWGDLMQAIVNLQEGYMKYYM